MTAPGIAFQRTLIRLAKSAIAAWEQWLDAVTKAASSA